jgi:hypothetical protein
LTTTINTSGYTPTQGVAKADGTFNWSAHLKMSSLHADWWKRLASEGTRRKIITRHSVTGAQIPFRWGDLSADQQAMLDPDAVATDAANAADPDYVPSSDILNYIRGDQSNEPANGGNLRARQNRLGDIVHSNPEYVGVPEDTHTESDYVQFKNDNANRSTGNKPRVYVGANDGMLHNLRAKDGYNAWSYLPSMLMPKLSRLAGVPYSHRYYVDGGITVRDAKLSGAWKTVLVGSLGAGGKGLYVLDVTVPGLPEETGTQKLITEVAAYDAVHGNDIGYIFDATTITKLNDGKWYAINGNGIASVDGVAKLVLIQLETGNVSLISTGSGDATDPNGLAAPALLDTDGDGDADIAWAGDVNGDMWRFDLTGTSGWHTDYKLFDGSEAQPITQAPDVTNHPQFGYLVLFGTGKLYEPADVTDSTVQAIYGVWDKGTTVTTASMLSQLLTGDLSYTGTTPAAETVNEQVRNFNPVVPVDYGTHPGGWYINLPAGERLLTPPALRAGRLKSTVTDPDGFSNWFLEATFDNGSASDDSIFDLNRDSDLSGEGDRVSGNGDLDLSDPEDIAMGWKRPNGNMSQVTIARLGPGQDTLFLNFLNPPLVEPPEPCSGNCTGGLEGGHMDIDTDLSYGGATETHYHEYDIDTNRTYIDYEDISPPPLVAGIPQPARYGLNNINHDFIVTIANADWSPGGRLTIGQTTYNVVEYQVMLHKAMKNWLPGHNDAKKGELRDPAGNSLIHSVKSILDDVDSDGNPGTLRITFDATALIYGGLVPSRTSCVKDSLVTPSNRWRSNALVIHLVDAGLVVGDYVNGSGTGQPLDRVRVQDITDTTFYERIILSDGTQIKLTEDFNDNDTIEGSNYEILGGITAKDEASFLYESTAFWHWSDKDGDELGECWSDSDAYRTAYRNVTTRIAVGMFLDKLAQETSFDTFEELVAAIELQKTSGCRATNSCSDDPEKLDALYEEGMLVFQVPDDGSELPEDVDEYQDGSLTGDPVIIEGGVAEGGLTSGPNFEGGRRTWIDILPD